MLVFFKKMYLLYLQPPELVHSAEFFAITENMDKVLYFTYTVLRRFTFPTTKFLYVSPS